MQAGLICEFIAANWGQEALAAMLDAYREGLDTRTAIHGALGIAAETFDAQFAAHVEAELGATVENIESWQVEQRAAHESAERGDWTEAAAASQRAIDLFPEYVDPGSAYLIRAQAEQEAGAHAAAVATLSTYHRLGGYDPEALMQLGRWLEEAGDRDGAIEVLEDVLLVAPLSEPAHADLGDWLLAAGRAEQALGEYEALFAMRPHDQAAAHFRLAKAHYGLDNLPLAREHLLYALEIAPNYREAQQLLLEIVR
jgi:tetratricopeptide (TPR) repeat protein